MIDADIEEAKAALRVRAQEQRRQAAKAAGGDAAGAAAEQFFAGVVLDPEDVVAAYWPIRGELDCRPVLARLMDNGQRVCLPAVLGDEQPLELRLWEQDAPLYPSGFGTLAPIETAPLVTPSVMIVPLLAFDGIGTRLGYGKGHYDRTIAAIGDRPRVIGYAYAGQEMERLPRAVHDIGLDAVVTEQGVRHFGTAPS
ncbi:MAG TPA: 5-formyltetrahydrofolate cyclo-ligase [Devosiaceae bacterium]|jgi:5-formyltetrahydrofolate cyclo-ligase|nr:5-formyltetrahydrofolate cyclo-ligase [Devosiaceae bacterium]